jgi:hypothetical protein
MKKPLMTLGLVLVAGIALASNTGFKLNYPIPEKALPLSSTYWMSLPTFYYPNGNVSTVGAQNSIDVCQDMNEFAPGAPKVASVARLNPLTDLFQTQSCRALTTKSYDLVPGEGYADKPAPGTVNAVVNVVGSNNDDMTSNKGSGPYYHIDEKPAPLSSTWWVSVPYHVKSNNSVEICAELNAFTTDKVASVARLNPDTDLFQTQSCTALTKKSFDLTPGEGYALKPKAGIGATGTDVAFDVY